MTENSRAASDGPPLTVPYYILTNTTPSTALNHPKIEYHYADDSPLALLPRSDEEQVVVLDYDPVVRTMTHTRSLSRALTVTHVKVADAPGTHAPEEAQEKDPRVFVIETAQALTNDADLEMLELESFVARFKQRNSTLRHLLHLFEEAPQTSYNSEPSIGIVSNLAST